MRTDLRGMSLARRFWIILFWQKASENLAFCLTLFLPFYIPPLPPTMWRKWSELRVASSNGEEGVEHSILRGTCKTTKAKSRLSRHTTPPCRFSLQFLPVFTYHHPTSNQRLNNYNSDIGRIRHGEGLLLGWESKHLAELNIYKDLRI